MISNQLNKLVLFTVLAMANLSSVSFASSPSKNPSVTIEYVKEGKLEEEKKVFIRSFREAYKNIPLDVLKVESLDSFLEAAFEDEPVDLNDPNKKVVCAVAKNAGSVVGVIFFEPTERENEVYVRQLAVDPAMQKMGIGQQLMSNIQKTLPTTKKIIVATRKVNIPACNFYRRLGFNICSHVPHDLNPERYVGFEKDIK